MMKGSNSTLPHPHTTRKKAEMLPSPLQSNIVLEVQASEILVIRNEETNNRKHTD